MTRLRQLHLLSGLLTGSSCPNCPPTSRARPWSTRREREGRGRRGRLAGAGRRGSTGGDIVELYACRRFCTGLLRCVCGCVTAGGECRSRLLFTGRYLSQAAFHLPTSPPPPPCPASPSAIQTCSSVSPASLSHRPPLTAPLQSCNFNQDYSCIAVGHKKGYTILNCDPFGKVHSNSTSLSLGRSAQYAVEADGCTR